MEYNNNTNPLYVSIGKKLEDWLLSPERDKFLLDELKASSSNLVLFANPHHYYRKFSFALRLKDFANIDYVDISKSIFTTQERDYIESLSSEGLEFKLGDKAVVQQENQLDFSKDIVRIDGHDFLFVKKTKSYERCEVKNSFTEELFETYCTLCKRGRGYGCISFEGIGYWKKLN